MNIEKANKPVKFNGAHAIVWPDKIKWPAGRRRSCRWLAPVDYCQISVSWDGQAAAWRIPALVEKIRVEKPRLWWCVKDRIYKCQLDLVQGRGMTKRWAYKNLMEKLMNTQSMWRNDEH